MEGLWEDEDELQAWIELLADDVGPRRPTSRSERLAAVLVAERLRARGLGASVEPFRGYATFGLPFGVILATAIAPSVLPQRLRAARIGLAALAGGGLLSEGSLVHTPLSTLLSARRSQNVVATVEPTGAARRTLCVMAHIDSSRSGLIFHPRLVGLLGRWIALNSVLVLVATGAEPLVGWSERGRRALAGLRAALAGSLALLLERELRGQDVPGANDNASGCAVALSLALRVASQRLKRTRLVLLITGCEEAGTLGARAFLASHDTSDWLFLNLDSLGSGGTLRYLTREGVIARWDADPGLIEIAAEVAERRPELRMAPEGSPAGLTYDTSPVLAGGGRALTLSVQDGSIPNLHRPSDTTANIDPGGPARALTAGLEIAAAIDRGGADVATDPRLAAA